MNGGTLLAAPHAWQDPRSVHTLWAFNDTSLDPQAFAPDYHPNHHYTGGYHIPPGSFAMPSYSPQYPHPEFWNSIMSNQPQHGHCPVNAHGMPQQIYSHSNLVPPQYYANANTGYSANPNQNGRPTHHIPQYGYGNYQRRPFNADARGVPTQAIMNGKRGPGPAACDRCSSALLPSPQAARVPQMPVSPASRTLARGPPRKPKRSGHAVWVGNIPMGASIEALKDHFSHQATRDIESVFLMAKSNCAFINYETEDACVAAVERFNHSLFGSVRLLCRLRREPAAQSGSSRSSETSLHSDSPAGSFTEDSSQVTSSCDSLALDLMGLGIQHDGDTRTDIALEEDGTKVDVMPSNPTDRYFIIKSLTKEDLQNSLQTGTWEMQPHNQRGFDDAFREAKNVYMIFSVNKSGEYFGYARMITSPLMQSPPKDTAGTSTIPAKQNDTLKITQTAATATAPAGYIINDTVRGTLFWEAQHENNGVVSSTLSALDRAEQEGHVRSNPFQVEWLSVRRVTFQRTKGIRNPWNNNKEVKIARDGTELETDIGKKIVSFFHKSSEEMIRRA